MLVTNWTVFALIERTNITLWYVDDWDLRFCENRLIEQLQKN